MWVTSQAGRSLWRIDPRTLEHASTRRSRDADGRRRADGLAVVASGPLEVAVHKIDAATGALLETIPIPGAEGAATAVAECARGSGWSAAASAGATSVASARTPLSGTSLPDRLEIFSENPNFVFGHEPDFPAYTDVAVGEGGVWMTLDSGPALRRADPTGQRPVEVMELPFFPRSVTVGAGSIWITALIDDMVARFDPETREVTMTVPLGRGTAGVAVGARLRLGGQFDRRDRDAIGPADGRDPGYDRGRRGAGRRRDRGGRRLGHERPRCVGSSLALCLLRRRPRPHLVREPASRHDPRRASSPIATRIGAPFYDVSLASAELPLLRRGGSLDPSQSSRMEWRSVGRGASRSNSSFGCAGDPVANAVEIRRLVEVEGVGRGRSDRT